MATKFNFHQYQSEYDSVIRSDALPKKRPKKLQCRPGFEQRGAACQKIKSGSKRKAGLGVETAATAGLVGAALVGGAALAAGARNSTNKNEANSKFSGNTAKAVAAAGVAGAVGAGFVGGRVSGAFKAIPPRPQ